MRIPGLNNRLIISGTLLLFLLVQLFSVHLHIGHVEEHQHDVHVHAGLFAEHHEFEFAEVVNDHGHDHHSHGYGDEKPADFTGWLGKKLSVFDLALVISFILLLALFRQTGTRKQVDSYLNWRHDCFFSPPLRAPPHSL